MAWKSITPRFTVPDPKADGKNAVRFGACRISDAAVYLNGRMYLPLAAVEKARIYASRLPSQGCCGLGVPVWYVLLYYGEEKPLRLLTESKEEARDVLAAILDRCPGTEVLEEKA